MFYVMNEDTLSIFDDSKEKIETTREFMPQLTGQLTLETDIVTAEELEAHPNKVIVGDVPVEIDVPDYEQATDEEGNPIYDEEGNPVMIPVMIDKEETIIVIDYDEEGNPIGEHTEIIIVKVPSTHKETIYVKGIVLNPDYEQEEETRRENEFNQAFFNTSLGYIRRKVTMADGSHKDFLSDLLPVISMGVQAGQAVNILAYDAPPFDEDVTDWTKYQHQKVVTAQFIQECFMQLSADFAPINEE